MPGSGGLAAWSTISLHEMPQVGSMSRQSAYRLRSRLKGKAFDVAWDNAFSQSYVNLPYAALERALNGVEVPHYYKGELIGTSRRYDERLTLALLKLSSESKVLVVGGPANVAECHGQRFLSLVASVEREGERAAADEPEAFSAADSTNLSPMSDNEILAELRRFGGKTRG